MQTCSRTGSSSISLSIFLPLPLSSPLITPKVTLTPRLGPPRLSFHFTFPYNFSFYSILLIGFHTNTFADSTCSNTHTQIGGPVITEDTALCFAAMNGLPGPYIKFFLRELGHEGTCVYTYSLPLPFHILVQSG